MPPQPPHKLRWALLGALLIVIGVIVYLYQNAPQAPSGSDTVTLALNQAGTLGGVALVPEEVTEDSRCPVDVQCIQAGRVVLRASVAGADKVFTLGEPIANDAGSITLTAVSPEKQSKVTIAPGDYRFTFKATNAAFTYTNASADLIKPSLPNPGGVTGKEFDIRGEARGSWYFEASFPVLVTDPSGAVLFQGPAKAEGDWMTTDFVPYSVHVSIPNNYSGPATMTLKKDNPSGDPIRDASVSYPITVEY